MAETLACVFCGTAKAPQLMWRIPGPRGHRIACEPCREAWMRTCSKEPA